MPIINSPNSQAISQEDKHSLETNDTPHLVGTSSQSLASAISFLNLSPTLSSAFSNNNEDIVSEIEYDCNWCSSEINRFNSHMSDEDWKTAVRVEFQKINALLSFGMKRSSYNVDNLSLVLASNSEDFDPVDVTITSLLEVLSTIPEYSDALTQKALIEGNYVNILPLPLDLDEKTTDNSLQSVLDNIFWAAAMGNQEEFDQSEIPVLESLNDVFIMIQCEPEITLDKEVWPERYTERYIQTIKQYWSRKKEIISQITEKQAKINSLSTHKESSVVESIERSISVLKEAQGTESAVTELESVLQTLKDKLTNISVEISKQQPLLDRHLQGLVVPINPMSLIPWCLKAVMWCEDTITPFLATLNDSKSYTWKLSHGSSEEILSWSDLLEFASKREDFIAMYEKRGAVKPPKDFAPSIKEFIKKDNAYLSTHQSPTKPESEHSVSECSSIESSSNDEESENE